MIKNNNLKISINLSKLSGVRTFTGKDGKKYVAIPIEENNLFEGQKGIYANLVALETENNRYGDTHYIKMSIPTEEYSAMTEVERREVPIIGNLRPIVSRVSNDQPQPQPTNDEPVFGDMPF